VDLKKVMNLPFASFSCYDWALFSWHCCHSTPSCASGTNYRVDLKLDYVNDVLEDLYFLQCRILWAIIQCAW